MNYNILSEISVIYASKIPKKLRDLFFVNNKEKFYKDLKHLDQENFYKIVWALVKAN